MVKTPKNGPEMQVQLLPVVFKDEINMQTKKRILVCGEASYLSTGFSTYSLELLTHLHNTGKYEVAELAAFGDPHDPRSLEAPWKFYPVFYDRNKPGDKEQYFSNAMNKFGGWKFEQTCLDFKPDVVIDVRDHWQLSFEESSPFRPYYHWSIMPTCDSEPQSTEWLATYMNADAVFTYSDWGLDVLNKEGGGHIKTICSAPPGADLNAYHVRTNKRQHRESKGIDPDALVVGTVMRNQKRKLFPDLIEAFATFLKEAPPELACKSFLYLHTCWPDVGWDIPTMLKTHGVSHKTLFTYMCKGCGAIFPSFFQDAKAHCRLCGEYSAMFPHTHLGISRKVLSEVYALFDVYVQYANSEGFGMPLVEAAACGIPVMAVDYSAMSDVVRKLRGTPIAVQRLMTEAETGCKRALPDNADFVRKLIDVLSLPTSVRAKLGFEARCAVEEHYTWPRTCKIWEDHLDSLQLRPHSETWLSAPKIHRPAQIPNTYLSNEEFVRWGFINVAGRQDLVNSYMAMRMVRDLNWEATLQGSGDENHLQNFNREIAYGIMLQLCEQRNLLEQKRSGK